MRTAECGRSRYETVRVKVWLTLLRPFPALTVKV